MADSAKSPCQTNERPAAALELLKSRAMATLPIGSPALLYSVNNTTPYGTSSAERMYWASGGPLRSPSPTSSFIRAQFVEWNLDVLAPTVLLGQEIGVEALGKH